MITVKCPQCGAQHEHDEPAPPLRAMRWCVWDTRDREPYSGWLIWEVEMRMDSDKVPLRLDGWWYIPRTGNGRHHYDYSFATRDEAFQHVLRVLQEELDEHQREIADMKIRYAGQPKLALP